MAVHVPAGDERKPEIPRPMSARATDQTRLAQTRRLASSIGNKQFSLMVARAADPAKMDAIRKELDSTLWASNAKLEQYWASFGSQLPEALEDPACRELWRRSVEKEKIDVRRAAGPLVAHFRNDSMNSAQSLLSAQSTRLANLSADLKAAAAAPKVSAPEPNKSDQGGVEDAARQMSRKTDPKPIADVEGLIDSATILHFLLNWKSMLRQCVVGAKLPETTLLPTPGAKPAPAPFEPFPNSPAGSLADNQGAAPPPSPNLTFDPAMSLEKLTSAADVSYVDVDAFQAVATTFRACEEKQSLLQGIAGKMVSEDANLAVLQEKGLLEQVSALGIHEPDHAGKVLLSTVEENLKAVDNCLRDMGKGDFDWRVLRPVHGLLLSGEGGSRNWAAGKGEGVLDGSAKGLIKGYFDREQQEEIDAAQLKFLLNVGFTVAAFAAMLTPAAPLGAALLTASNAYFAANAVIGIAEAGLAEKRAGQLDTAAKAGVADKDEAKAAKAEADEKNAAVAVDLLMAAVPYMPAVLKGAGRAGAAVAGELRFSKFVERASRLSGAHPFAVGADIVVDLAKVGLSALAKGRVGGELSSLEMLSKIKPINRTVRWVAVSEALKRAGAERQLTAGSKYGLKGYVRYHIHGPGTGFEGYPILMAPEGANQFANNHIEEFMRTTFKQGAKVKFRANIATFGGGELRVFVEGMLNSGNKEIMRRLALDYGRIEKFLKAITYDIEITRAGRIESWRANITVGAPGTGIPPAMTNPTLISSVPVP